VILQSKKVADVTFVGYQTRLPRTSANIYNIQNKSLEMRHHMKRWRKHQIRKSRRT